MKNIVKLLFGSFLLATAFSSCEKDEHRVIYEGGTPPVLTSTSTGALVLTRANQDNLAMKLSWTNPDYSFNTGISSQNVNYVLQVDTVGANFTNPKKQEQVISKELSVSMLVKDLNLFLTKMELVPGIPHNLQMRIKSTLASGAVPLYSNVFTVTVTPYLDFVVEPPGTAAAGYNDGELWVVGDASPGGWNNPLLAPYNVSQKFTKISVTLYTLDMTFNATGGYKLVQTMGVWGTQYHALDGTAKFSGDFEKRDADPQFPSPGLGLHRVVVNFATGKYTVTKL